MITEYCPSCHRETGHKRALGWGTFFAAILTWGFWLLILPFYPKRCIVCGTQIKKATPARGKLYRKDTKGNPKISDQIKSDIFKRGLCVFLVVGSLPMLIIIFITIGKAFLSK